MVGIGQGVSEVQAAQPSFTVTWHVAVVCVLCAMPQVKIADFGVARMIEANGHMTAETGTYRWMAPEVIEHKPYDEKVGAAGGSGAGSPLAQLHTSVCG